MKLEMLSPASRRVLEAAVTLAERLRHAEVRPCHLLAALLDASDGVTSDVLRRRGADPDALLGEVSAIVVGCKAGLEPSVSIDLLVALETAVNESRKFGDPDVGLEVLLLGIAGGHGREAALLKLRCGAPDEIRAAVDMARGGEPTPPAPPRVVSRFWADEQKLEDVEEPDEFGEPDELEEQMPDVPEELFDVPWEELNPLLDRWGARLASDVSWALDQSGRAAEGTLVRHVGLIVDREERWRAWRTVLSALPRGASDPASRLVWWAHYGVTYVVKGGLDGDFGNDFWWCGKLGQAVTVAASTRATWPAVSVDDAVVRQLTAEAEGLTDR